MADRIRWRSTLILNQESDSDKCSTHASVYCFEAGLN